ncbi:MAG: hypothetical protein ABW148_15590 [Sedimenticola sp.]
MQIFQKFIFLSTLSFLIPGCVTNPSSSSINTIDCSPEHLSANIIKSIIARHVEEAKPHPGYLKVPLSVKHGNLIPVQISLKEPLINGNTLQVYVNKTKNLAYTVTPSKNAKIYSFSGRVRSNDGHVTVVINSEENPYTKTKIVTVDKPVNIPKTGRSTNEVKCLSIGNVFKIEFRQIMALDSYLKSITLSYDEGTIEIRMTPHVTGPYGEGRPHGYAEVITKKKLNNLRIQIQ